MLNARRSCAILISILRIFWNQLKFHILRMQLRFFPSQILRKNILRTGKTHRIIMYSGFPVFFNFSLIFAIYSFKFLRISIYCFNTPQIFIAITFPAIFVLIWHCEIDGVLGKYDRDGEIKGSQPKMKH